ncbi:DNA-binding LacI/PurR family transcriptional regulator [Frondihabitans sp. PhB188]|uniref:LacI family DNA-binding transcriptional regulator n=1 Tax=Frondihabitans sp. PhB188 TaxID=2485200 RepID=UPI000F4750A3|nr:LacI family DNA-binding transcriptional regulator [Frondihabitans sp. PhB188]ROQ36598.1 DNA-binding LacI/PurR family transcriptional regulator [Frondihabitans sp. PhB188]
MTEPVATPPQSRGGRQRATIYDVAEAAGVSKSLVSLVLQGSPKVSTSRRTSVERAIAELNYRPSRAAAALAGHRSRTIGVVVDDFRNLWFVDLLDGMREIFEPLGLSAIVADSAHDAGGGLTVIDNFVASKADALVIACEPTPEMMVAQDIPVVVAGNRARAIPGATVISSDDARGARIATQHLIDLGHIHIGHLTGEGGSAALRGESYRQTMIDAGLEPITRSGSGRTNEPDGFAAAQRLLADEPATTAVFAANDTMALGALAAVHDIGRRVPEDVSLIGYDNSPLASSQILRLTTIEDDSRDVGRLVARAVVAVLDDERTDAAGLVEPSLVIRASTGAPSSR